MPKYATANSLSDYQKLTISQFNKQLKRQPQSYLHLTYTYQNQPYDYHLQLTTTACHFGSRRYWFLCPKCSRRVSVLFMNGLLVCRHCLGVSYQSQLKQPDSRLFAKINDMRERLGWQGGVLCGHGPKPKGMHQRTFTRLVGEYVRLERLALISIDNTYGKIDRQLASISKRTKQLKI